MSEFANVCDPLLVLGRASLKESESSLMHGEGIHISYKSFFNFVRSFQSEDNDTFGIEKTILWHDALCSDVSVY